MLSSMNLRYILGWLLAILFVVNAQAGDHLHFLDVSMNTTAYNFCKKLAKRGLTVRDMDDAKHPWEVSLSGKMNADSCILVVSSTPRSHRVYEVRVGKLKHHNLTKDDANRCFNEQIKELVSEFHTKFKLSEKRQREVKTCEADITHGKQVVGRVRVVLRKNIFGDGYSIETHLIDNENYRLLEEEYQGS